MKNGYRLGAASPGTPFLNVAVMHIALPVLVLIPVLATLCRMDGLIPRGGPIRGWIVMCSFAGYLLPTGTDIASSPPTHLPHTWRIII